MLLMSLKERIEKYGLTDANGLTGAKNKMNEDYLTKNEYVSNLPKDSRAGTDNSCYNNDNGGGSGSSDPMLNDYVVESNGNDLLVNQVILPVASDVSDLNTASNSTSIHNNNHNKMIYYVHVLAHQHN